MNIDIKALNKLIKEKGVAKELAVRLKQRRRTLKNRNYATRLLPRFLCELNK